MPATNDSTAPCEVCGDPVPEGLRYMAGPFGLRMFCEAHDPLRGGPRAGYPELGTGACEGHPAGPFDPMGETVYCDGSCAGHPDPEQKRVERTVRQYRETCGHDPSPHDVAMALCEEDVENGEYEGCSGELELAASDYIARAERVL